jgi:hypothetical protein
MTAQTTPAALKQSRASVPSGFASDPYGVTLTGLVVHRKPRCHNARRRVPVAG